MASSPDPDRVRCRWARAAGSAYLLIIACGLFAELGVRGSILAPDDPAATVANLARHEQLYRVGLASELVMLVADVFVAGALVAVFDVVSPRAVRVAAYFRLVHAAIVGANLLHAYLPLLLVGAGASPGGLPAAARQHWVATSLQLHGYGYAVGLVFFGVHCAVLGGLLLRARAAPRLLAVLLVLAAGGYWIDSFARTLLVRYVDHAQLLGTLVLLPALVAELSFSLWLLVRGGRDPRGSARTRE